MSEKRVYTIVCLKLINYTTPTGENCLNDLLMPTPDQLYSAQIIKNLPILTNEVFLPSLSKREMSSWLMPTFGS